MNLRTFVKVGSITNLSDARFCAGFGVDLLGFAVDPNSEDFIDIDQANEIMGWVAGPAFVAEAGDLDFEDILKLQEENKFPYIQVNDPVVASQLIASGHQAILKLNISSDDDLKNLSQDTLGKIRPAYVIVDCTSPEMVPEIDKKLDSIEGIPLIKAFDVELSQLDHIVQVQPYAGIELKGSQEDKPGFKEYDDLADILEALEEED